MKLFVSPWALSIWRNCETSANFESAKNTQNVILCTYHQHCVSGICLLWWSVFIVVAVVVLFSTMITCNETSDMLFIYIDKSIFVFCYVRTTTEMVRFIRFNVSNFFLQYISFSHTRLYLVRMSKYIHTQLDVSH